MKTCNFDDRELELLNHAVCLLQREFRKDLKNYVQNFNLDILHKCIDGLSTIEFILPKISIDL